MRYRLIIFFLLIFAFHSMEAQSTHSKNMIFIKGGSFTPLYIKDSTPVFVGSFFIDKYPVTNKDFVEFVKKNPQWDSQKIKALFADKSYLKHWKENNLNDELFLKAPVTNVSWFAAKAYCECQGKRLPTVAEWEFVSLASESKPNASDDLAFYQRTLDWYAKPNPKLFPPVETSFKNYYGIYGLVGLVWEWTSDFNSSFLPGDARGKDGANDQKFCGAGSNNATDTRNYVAFMRYAFRSSLKARYTVANLGFRCVSKTSHSF